MQGYNISITYGGKTLIGVTQDELNISAKFKESITKDNAGVTQKVVTGHDVTTKATLVAAIDSSTGTSTTLDRDDIIDMGLAVGSSAVLACTYACTGGKTYTGNAICTAVSESSPASADDDVTMTVELNWITFAASA